MTTTETRSFDVEIRANQRTVYGIAVPFGETIDLGHYRERFVRGAFERTIRERGSKVKLLAQHNHATFPIGRAVLLEERPQGLWLEARVANTSAGDEALQLVADGAVDSFSVGFQPIESRTARDGVVERTQVALREVSLVGLPAYTGAVIAGVRSADRQAIEAARRPALLRHRIRIMEMKK